ELRARGCYPGFLTEAQVQNFYTGYSNGTLWPNFHYFPGNTEYEACYWDAYKKVNSLFRDAVLKHAQPDSMIWVHDYHLMLLPRLLRSKLPSSSIGFFL